jgi:hypothetical protein
MRTDKKPKAIPKHSERQRTQEIGFGFENQFDLFMTLWANAKDEHARVTCPYTGEQLNRYYRTDLFWSCFMHLLAKKNWPYFKLNPANIRIVHPNLHRIFDAGTRDERKQHPEWKWDLIDSEVIALKEEYANFKKENLLA